MTFFSIRRLRDEHAWLDQELAIARRAEPPDPEHIAGFKARKLALKSRIAALEVKRQIAPGGGPGGRPQVATRRVENVAEAPRLSRPHRDGGLPASNRIWLSSAGRTGREARTGSYSESPAARESE